MATITLQIEQGQVSRFAQILQADYESLAKEIHEMEVKLEGMKDRAGSILSQIEQLKGHVTTSPERGGWKEAVNKLAQSQRISLEKLKQAVYDQLRSSGTLGVTELCERTGASSSSIYRALHALRDEKEVENAGREWQLVCPV
ncbi:helix-turn-helix domain-containing protein [Roseimicrobium sp. ORNL1]|uniref:helix-turn-helix domain-containing protein n=1 Tax=Roseimicrobium sp. ORNL1 TaxID=2711231 RepID=UPI0013E18FF4|nr:helix-turn-helix domain-containing protein [Roseimicrobium sp. ORNL1]QIF00080.1 helix-turn-helix domain-containing protein [Roseimicrobium sp. ORNL1]